MIAVYAEKFDVASKIAAALGGIMCDGKIVTIKDIETYKNKLKSIYNKKGYIKTTYLGENYIITWGRGHMCTLYQASDYDPEYRNWNKIPLPIIPKEYKIKIRDGYDMATRKKTNKPDAWVIEQLKIIEKIFNESSYIINATDDDREGDLIFSYVYEYLKCDKPYKRLAMNSQTESGIRDAFRSLRGSDVAFNVEEAGRARSIADWVVGANLSAKLTLKFNKYFPDFKMITAGRIQTVILDFIVTREKAIRDFKSEKFYYVEALFSKNGENYVGKHPLGQIFDRKEAEKLLEKVNGHKGKVISKDKVPFKKEVPLLYNLTDLSKDMNKLYGFKATETLAVCQSLYEKGFTTYPRTDSSYLTDDMKGVVDDTLNMLAKYKKSYGDIINSVSDRNYTKRHFDSSKVESHFAIIPTTELPSGLSDKEEKVYDLLARSLMKIIFKPAQGEKTKIKTDVNGEVFSTNGSVITDPQWLVVEKIPQDDYIPNVDIGDIVDGEYKLKDGSTKAPSRYTEATLLSAMQTASKEIEDEKLKQILKDNNKGGIGRPSTQAGLIANVIDRYCTMNGKFIVPTDNAITFIDVMPIDDLKSPEMTAKWESDLDKIAKGDLNKDVFIEEIENSVIKWCKEIDDENLDIEVASSDYLTEVKCPVCGSYMRKLKWGWACSSYDKDNPDSCKFAVGYDISGAKLTDKDIEYLLEHNRSSKMYTFNKKDSKEKYSAYLIVADGKLGRTWDTGRTCPLCGGQLKVSDKSWYCENWKNGCKFTIWKTIAGKKITDKNLEMLLTNKKTGVINGFTSKKGTSFSAYLMLKEDGTVGFEFPKRKS